MEYYRTQFQQGMHGPLAYYRTWRHRYDEERGEVILLHFSACFKSVSSVLAANLSSFLSSDLPVLFMWGEADVTATPVQIDRAGKFIPRLQNISLNGKGHWVMVEAKDQVTYTVVHWLGSVIPKTVIVKL